MAHTWVLEHVLITLNFLPLMTHLSWFEDLTLGKSNREDSVFVTKSINFRRGLTMCPINSITYLQVFICNSTQPDPCSPLLCLVVCLEKLTLTSISYIHPGPLDSWLLLKIQQMQDNGRRTECKRESLG